MRYFREEVFDIVQRIPKGKVASYGQVAVMIGDIRLARNVGYALSSLGIEEKIIPWWRVVNRDGFITINQQKGGVEKKVQKELLLHENVEFIEEWRVDMEKFLYQWDR